MFFAVIDKGEPSDCYNYRGISLLSIVVKVFLVNLQNLLSASIPNVSVASGQADPLLA